jgi:hypothetical protein
MYKIILIIPFLNFLYKTELPSTKSSIEGTYEWTCSFYENSTFAGMNFYETKGNLYVKSYSNKIEFLFEDGEKSYSFKLTRDTIYNLEEYHGEYKIVQSKTHRDSGTRLKPMINLLSFAFLLQESNIDNDNLRLVSREITYKAKKRISKFKEDQKHNKIVFEIYNEFGDPKLVNKIAGNFNLDSEERNYLECMFETYFPTSCCLSKHKGIITMKKIK